jgi:hypothetical protein
VLLEPKVGTEGVCPPLARTTPALAPDNSAAVIQRGAPAGPRLSDAIHCRYVDYLAAPDHSAVSTGLVDDITREADVDDLTDFLDTCRPLTRLDAYPIYVLQKDLLRKLLQREARLVAGGTARRAELAAIQKALREAEVTPCQRPRRTASLRLGVRAEVLVARHQRRGPRCSHRAFCRSGRRRRKRWRRHGCTRCSTYGKHTMLPLPTRPERMTPTLKRRGVWMRMRRRGCARKRKPGRRRRQRRGRRWRRVAVHFLRGMVFC